MSPTPVPARLAVRSAQWPAGARCEGLSMDAVINRWVGLLLYLITLVAGLTTVAQALHLI